MLLPYLRIALGLLLLVVTSVPAVGRMLETENVSDMALAWTRPLWRGARPSRLPAGLVVYLVALLPLVAIALAFILLCSPVLGFLGHLAGGAFIIALGVRTTARTHHEAEVLIATEGRQLLEHSVQVTAPPSDSARTEIQTRKPGAEYRAHLARVSRRIPKASGTPAAARLVAMEMLAQEIRRVDGLLPHLPRTT